MARFSKRHAQNDFTADMLPHSRKEVFRDVAKWNFGKLMLLGLILLLAASPIIVLTIAEDEMISNMWQGIDTVTEEASQAVIYEIFAVSNTTAAIKIPFLILFFIILGGTLRVIRQYAFGKNVFFGLDFWHGIRENAKQMALLGLLAAVMYALSVITFNLSLTTTNSAIAVLFTLPILLSVFVGIPLVAYALVSITIYDTSFIKILGASMLITAKSAGKTVAALGLCLLAFIPSLIPNVYFHFVGGIILPLILPFVLLYWYVQTLDRLDEHINKDNYPHLVGIGTVHAAEFQEE